MKSRSSDFTRPGQLRSRDFYTKIEPLADFWLPDEEDPQTGESPLTETLPPASGRGQTDLFAAPSSTPAASRPEKPAPASPKPPVMKETSESPTREEPNPSDLTPEIEADLTGGLNPPQLEAVRTTEGPLLILAGAGSGKTRVIIRRIGWLIRKQGVPPWRILAVTFTNKAAAEMRERLRGLIGPLSEEAQLSTFHALGLRLLRYEGKVMGLPSGFTVYDQSDQEALLKKCLKDLKIDPKKLRPKAFAGVINSAKDKLQDWEEFAREQETDSSPISQKAAEVYQYYEEQKEKNKALDFADLIFRTVKMFKQFPEVLEKYQRRWQYIMVDEYQDTNHAQYVLTTLLARGHGNIAVVGDDDQSIYSWRGAEIRNILDFERDYANCRNIKLEQNYRSTGFILQAANSVIRNNRDRKDKTLWTEASDGHRPEIIQTPTDLDEADFVADTILDLSHRHKRPLSDFTVFYRTNSQSRTFEEVFRRRSLPYKIVGGLNFYDRKEIKDLMAYLSVLVNPAADVALGRIINYPARGIGGTTMDRLNAWALLNGLTLWDALKNHDEIPRVNAKKLGPFISLIEELRSAMEGGEGLFDLVEMVLEKTGIREQLEREDSIEAQSRLQNIEEFLNSVAEYEEGNPRASLLAYLQDISLFTSEEVHGADKQKNGDGDKAEDGAQEEVVTFMTIHNAKGLEFPVVFMAGMEEEVFPHFLSLEDNDGDVEEERRLCYVGMTRAMERLFLITCSSRRIHGQRKVNMPSRFLNEIDPDFVRDRRRPGSGFRERPLDPDQAYPNPAPRGAYGELVDDGWGSMDEAARERGARFGSNKNQLAGGGGFGADDYQKGQMVRHSKFGEGLIIAVTGRGDKQMLMVQFPGQGVKQFAARYADLTVLAE